MKKIFLSVRNMRCLKNSIYVFIWALVSLISSFNKILEWDWSFVIEADFHCGIVAPLLIWIVAFFADYIYTISMIEEGQELDKFWTGITYVIIMFIFVVLVVSTFHHESLYLRWIWLISLFISIILLKTSSLCVIRTTVKLKSV